MLKTLHRAIVESNRQIAPGAFVLQFKRPFDFTPGQVTGLTLQADNEPRLYSIASGKDADLVDILYTIKPDGLLTPPLSKLQPGDTIWRTEAFGRFLCPEEKAIWIAAGTGIAPFVSMALSGYSAGKMLIYGNRSHEFLYYQDLMQPLMGQQYIACCSRNSSAGTFHGRVTDYLLSLPDLDIQIPFYLCGSAEMVVDVRDILIERGVPFERITAEIFF